MLPWELCFSVPVIASATVINSMLIPWALGSAALAHLSVFPSSPPRALFTPVSVCWCVCSRQDGMVVLQMIVCSTHFERPFQSYLDCFFFFKYCFLFQRKWYWMCKCMFFRQINSFTLELVGWKANKVQTQKWDEYAQICIILLGFKNYMFFFLAAFQTQASQALSAYDRIYPALQHHLSRLDPPVLTLTDRCIAC